jgi:hypothetical protein
MDLIEEIDRGRAEIKSDSYPMSIGELTSIYESGELDIHPEFQRFFRWKDAQKSRLIESIILGIPIPPIFVSQRDDGIWDVIDGLQRLSTVFQLLGVLKDEKKQPVEPLVLQDTEYLPSLAGQTWRSLPPPTKLIIKRAKLDMNILLKESDPKAKFELFNRLNSGGSTLSAQEVRNCLLVMIQPSLYDFIKDLANHQSFLDCISISDKNSEEQYNLELVLRFLVFRKLDIAVLRRIGDVHQFLTNEMKKIAWNSDYDRSIEEKAFRFTFDVLAEQLGENCCRRYNLVTSRFVGGFLISAFEAVALGVGFHSENIGGNAGKIDFLDRVKAIWADDQFLNNIGSGVRASSRIPITIPLGRKVFS